MEIKDFSEVINKLNQKSNEQNKKANLFQKNFEEEIKNIGSILERIEMTSFGRLSSNDDNTNISNDKEIFNFRNVNTFIIENKIIEEILNLLKINSKFLTTKRDRLNDFIHYNGFLYLNYDKLDFEKKYAFIEEIFNEIKLYTKIFILFCTTNCDYFCTRSVYVDCLELGIEPVEGMQYIMMPVLDKYVMENFNEEEINYIRDRSSLKFGDEADSFMDNIQF